MVAFFIFHIRNLTLTVDVNTTDSGISFIKTRIENSFVTTHIGFGS